mmetsp:Transcript_35194/g.62748  ORF Transcript_35194/g.62748 Transcript_35194/m.62748 type:complete len:385 (-) Transcript_35194:124-1278(-)|eukprot:CAMPEP_0177770954 /NCGR_PEP_ID=MMETSP0491_2-20121128/11255_1 /TAXON_ID=63592 /ORGANISM="Tetraselmis chuii, Strain PLY429" /LENGTH=384 /DNA_ID=CAMNT_0019288313 /DNA_START=351 /DNA_END=1505 /DNA_ORIENTATION=-
MAATDRSLCVSPSPGSWGEGRFCDSPARYCSPTKGFLLEPLELHAAGSGGILRVHEQHSESVAALLDRAIAERQQARREAEESLQRSSVRELGSSSPVPFPREIATREGAEGGGRRGGATEAHGHLRSGSSRGASTREGSPTGSVSSEHRRADLTLVIPRRQPGQKTPLLSRIAGSCIVAKEAPDTFQPAKSAVPTATALGLGKEAPDAQMGIPSNRVSTGSSGVEAKSGMRLRVTMPPTAADNCVGHLVRPGPATPLLPRGRSSASFSSSALSRQTVFRLDTMPAGGCADAGVGQRRKGGGAKVATEQPLYTMSLRQPGCRKLNSMVTTGFGVRNSSDGGCCRLVPAMTPVTTTTHDSASVYRRPRKTSSVKGGARPRRAARK